MSKADIDGTLFRFGVYKGSRGNCNQCGIRGDTVLVRLMSPIKKELRTCYSCLIKFLLKEAGYAKEIKEKAQEAIDRIEAKKALEKDDFTSLKELGAELGIDKPESIGFARLSDITLTEREGQWNIITNSGSNSKKEDQD